MPRAGLDADAVVSAAAHLADAEGLHAVTLARLAKQLGVRSPSLYAHVDGLEDLQRRLAARGVAELAAALKDAAVGRADRDALEAIAHAYRAYARAHPGTYAATQRAPLLDNESAQDVVDVILAILRGYGITDTDAVHAVRALRAALHGFVALELQQGFGLPLDVDESFRRLIDLLDRGLQ